MKNLNDHTRACLIQRVGGLAQGLAPASPGHGFVDGGGPPVNSAGRDTGSPVAEGEACHGSEWRAIALLLVLYTLQGVPIGFAECIPFVLQVVSRVQSNIYSTIFRNCASGVSEESTVVRLWPNAKVFRMPLFSRPSCLSYSET